MGFAAITDLGYALRALWDTSRLQPMLRWWAQRRYDALAPRYDAYIAQRAAYGAALEAAMDRIRVTPRRVLDVSTGTGFAAEAVARRFPAAVVAACDLSMPMAHRARARLRTGTVFCCDSTHLPFVDGAFDLVILQNAPPSLRELARMVAPTGRLVLAFSTGAILPAWIQTRLERRLRDLGFTDVIWDRAGEGLCAVASRPPSEGSE